MKAATMIFTIFTIAALLVLQHGGMATRLARTCLSCAGINCQRTTRNQTAHCLDPLDYCVTIYDGVTVVHKGCSSELPVELRRHCDANRPACRKCFGNACNDLGPDNARCLQCDSAHDANCALNADALTPSACAAATAMNAYCYVRYSSSSSSSGGNGGASALTTQRGCAVSTEAQMACYDSPNCALCLPSDVSGCNNYDFTPNTRYRSL